MTASSSSGASEFARVDMNSEILGAQHTFRTNKQTALKEALEESGLYLYLFCYVLYVSF